MRDEQDVESDWEDDSNEKEKKNDWMFENAINEGKNDIKWLTGWKKLSKILLRSKWIEEFKISKNGWIGRVVSINDCEEENDDRCGMKHGQVSDEQTS